VNKEIRGMQGRSAELQFCWSLEKWGERDIQIITLFALKKMDRHTDRCILKVVNED